MADPAISKPSLEELVAMLKALGPLEKGGCPTPRRYHRLWQVGAETARPRRPETIRSASFWTGCAR